MSTWLASGVDATQVARCAGHSVAVLLTTYAKCLDDRDDIAKRRIEAMFEVRVPRQSRDGETDLTGVHRTHIGRSGRV